MAAGADGRIAGGGRMGLEERSSVARLAASMAHVINNQIAVVMAHAGLARMLIEETDGAGESVDEILKASERLGRLVTHLGAFARLPPGLETTFDLDTSLENIERLVLHLLPPAIALQIEGRGACPWVRAHQDLVEHAVLALAFSTQAVEVGGRFVIRLVPLTHHACVEVALEGCAVSEEALAQLVAWTAQLPWSIEVSPAGDQVQLFLPVEEEPLAAPEAPTPKAKVPATILLVEDDPHVRRASRSLLMRRGYEVLDTNSAGEALLIAEQHPGVVDLLMADVGLPRLDGLGLAARLKQTWPTLRCLFISSQSIDGARARAVDPDFGFLSKPFGAQALYAVVEALTCCGSA